MNSATLTCGLVIYNEFTLVKNLISLVETELKNYSFEWIIVLNHENNEIRKEIQIWLNKYFSDFKIIENPSNNIGQARQKILENSTADLVYFLDPDIEIQPESIQKLLELHQRFLNSDELIIGYGGPNQMISKYPYLSQVFTCFKRVAQLNFLAFQIQNHRSLTKVDHLPTCHLLLKKEIALSIGGFSTDFQKVGEDLDFSHRAFIHKFNFIFDPQAKVLHWQNSTIQAWLQKCFQYGIAQIKVQQRYWPKLRIYRLIPALTPLIIIGLCLFIPVKILFLFIGFIVVGELLGFSWIGFGLSILCYGVGEFFEIIRLPFVQKNVKQPREQTTNPEKKCV